MQYYVMDFSSFYKRYAQEFPLGLKTVYGDLAPEPGLNDFRPFFPGSFVVTVLDGDKFVGASCSYTCSSPVMKGGEYATNLFIYVKPEYRNTLVPGRLIKTTEKVAKKKGVKSYCWDVDSSSPLIPALNKRPEYKVESIIYRKTL